jgi:hypothetical protein
MRAMRSIVPGHAARGRMSGVGRRWHAVQVVTTFGGAVTTGGGASASAPADTRAGPFADSAARATTTIEMGETR